MTEAQVRALFEYIDVAMKDRHIDHLIDHHGGSGKWIGLPPSNLKELAQEKLVEILCRQESEVLAKAGDRRAECRPMRTPDEIMGEALTHLDFERASSRSLQLSVVLILELLLDIRAAAQRGHD